jgi:hypothetical protein
MRAATMQERRNDSREALYETRRRYGRVLAQCDVFYESDSMCALFERADVSMRGLFLPCFFPDREGTRGILRLDTGEGPMIRMEVEVFRSPTACPKGMAVRVVALGDEDRFRLGAFLLRAGGLRAFPQLDRNFRTVTRAPRPLRALIAA